MAKRKTPYVIDKELLNKKGTKELLGYLKRLHQCEDSFEGSDMYINDDLTDDKTIYFKETEKWKTAYSNVKSILISREHIDK
jgi:hypothetical protein